MSLKEKQEQVDEWVSQFNPPYWPHFEQFARLAEEVGEVAREMNHTHGSKKKKLDEEKNELGQELADVFFTLCCIANSNSINLEQEWQKMFEEKMNKRDANRFQKAIPQP